MKVQITSGVVAVAFWILFYFMGDAPRFIDLLILYFVNTIWITQQCIKEN